MNQTNPINESYRDSISTIDKEGKRVWIYPKKPKGPWYNKRTWLSYFLLLFLFAVPFIKIGGEPLLMINIIERKFVLFGQVFWPQDFHLFAFAMITLFVFVILFTVVFGRLFCGWVCPQTIFMEMLFRKIEYWIEGDWTNQKALTKAPWNGSKIVKRGGKLIIFYGISFFIANIFLAYIIGSDAVIQIISDNPKKHITGLIAILLFSFVFFFVFSYFREQVCTTICPYGRLQGVLLDKNSIVISYDNLRGENRAKIHKGENRKLQSLGDCIDCKQCVHVCPTGIDIRNGTQLECVNCTACIDACDEVMDKVGLPTGLIRYDSDHGIATGKSFTFTTRIKAYIVVLLLLIGVFFGIIFSRTEVETTILRTPGLMYQKKGETQISNLYNFKIINKTSKSFPVKFELEGMDGTIELIGKKSLHIEKQASLGGTMFIILPKQELTKTKTTIKVSVYNGNKKIETIKTQFTGPIITRKK